MKLYLDSAEVGAWTLPAGCPPVCGVTTNPSLVHQAGLPVTPAGYERLVLAAADHGMAELMLQLPDSDPAACRAWHDRLRSLAHRKAVRLTIKLPCHATWQGAITAMRDAGQPVLLTGLSNPVQLLWARSQQASYVAPYVGRLAADGRDVWSLVQACVAVQSAAGPALLAASIKSPDVLARLLGGGAAAATLAPHNLVAWSRDALTEAAMAQFARDVQASQLP